MAIGLDPGEDNIMHLDGDNGNCKLSNLRIIAYSAQTIKRWRAKYGDRWREKLEGEWS